MFFAVTPVPPEIETRDFIESETQMNIKCHSMNGRPAANLSWYLDGKELPIRREDFEYVDSVDTFNQTLTSVTLHLNRRAEVFDDGKRLVCRAWHVGYPETENGTYSDAATILNIKYPPVSLPEQRFPGLVLGTTARITIQIQANPQPKISWVIAGQTFDQGAQRDRFIAYEPRQIVSIYGISHQIE